MSDLNDVVAADRWRAARRLELDFRIRWQTLPFWQALDIADYWRREIAHFGGTRGCFHGLRVLDVDCGPFGLIHFVDHASDRIRVDPLPVQYSQKLALDGRQLSVCAMAESLPLANRSVDLAICFNALDHMRDPRAVPGDAPASLHPQIVCGNGAEPFPD